MMLDHYRWQQKYAHLLRQKSDGIFLENKEQAKRDKGRGILFFEKFRKSR